MANLPKIEFLALDITGKNYLSRVIDAEIHLESMGLGDTLKEENNATSQNKAKALIFLRRHLDKGLKGEYLMVKDPKDLWRNLKERYDHLKTVILPRARYEWLHLRLQDFKSVAEYNSEMFKITSKLRLCGERITNEEMLEKTFSNIGLTGHWSRTCRTPKYLVELYQASQKEKEKDKHVEVNFTDKGNRFGAKPSNRFEESPSKLTHLEIADFFEKNDNSANEL